MPALRCSPRRFRRSASVLLGATIGLSAATSARPSPEAGLLFSLSADHGTTADFAAAGTPEPTFDSEVKVIPDGAKGAGLSCGDLQRLAWRAPGNIYAQRGTLSFFWRSRYPVGSTEFPIFRVAFADHSSWDMVWLRIDYNGRGFDAFVTDANLARTRVSVTLPQFPAPDHWTHLALAWDETRGIRFFVDGKLAATREAQAVYDIALDQFGPHSRIISPHNVQSDYNFVRGGDIDEIRIYDHLLDDAAVATLARGETPVPSTLVPRVATPADVAAPHEFRDAAAREEWWLRHGWNRAGDSPAPLPAGDVAVRKIEIHDAYDLKRWWWKANDGIPETTWPGVYNRSRLPGRHDYFTLPDWDCYSLSGKSITFMLPAEPWNHLEISGAAFGKMELLPPETPNESASEARALRTLFERPAGQEKTFHDLAAPLNGGKIRFTNVEQETPIAELSAYLVTPGGAPAGSRVEAYRLAFGDEYDPYVDGRYPPDERSLLFARPHHENSAVSASNEDEVFQRALAQVSAERRKSLQGTGGPPQEVVPAAELSSNTRKRADARTSGGSSLGGPATNVPSSDDVGIHAATETPPGFRERYRLLEHPGLPVVHVIFPKQDGEPADGLDGIALDLPAFNFKPTHGGLIPFNLRVHDPLWPMRDMFDFSFSVRPGEAHTLWLDLRDRILPPGGALSFTLACASPELSAESLLDAHVRLIFKPREAARGEHERDRFTQARDAYAMLVEEHPLSPKLNLWVRFESDLKDLLRVNPNHELGRQYAAVGLGAPDPEIKLPDPPPGVPLWAYRQVDALGRMARFVNWWIDHRQIANGEFGGGLSDDTDLTNLWPGVALMGCDPDKLAASLRAELDACYAEGMLTRGLPTLQGDELHSYEEGTNSLGQNLILNFGSPRQLERAMEISRSYDWLTAVNAAGHRHIRSSYYSGTGRIATEEPWGYAKAYSYLILQPGSLLVDYNGSPLAKKLLLEITDGLLAHGRRGDDGRFVLPSAIRFIDDHEGTSTRGYLPWPLFWNAWQWTGKREYLAPIVDGGIGPIMGVNADAIGLLGLGGAITQKILALPTSASGADPRRASGRGSPRSNPARAYEALHFRWQLSGDEAALAELYASQIQEMAVGEYINTTGSLWIDRVGVPTTEIQRERLGGVALVRNSTFPGHTVSWRVAAPATAESVAILVRDATPGSFRIIAYNLADVPVHVRMTGWNVEPGQWESRVVPNADGRDAPGGASPDRTDPFGRSQSIDLEFPPHVTTVRTFTLKKPGTPYWQRADLGLDPEDVTVQGRQVCVKVHSLGAIASPETMLAWRDTAGVVRAEAKVPAIAAPADLQPKIAEVNLELPPGMVATDGTIEIDPEHRLEEITRLNNTVKVPGGDATPEQKMPR